MELKVTGHLGRDPQVITNVNGTQTVHFSVAYTKMYSTRTGGPVQETTWINCKVSMRNEALSNQAMQLAKGQQVTLKGEMSVRIWEREDGTSVPQVDLFVNEIATEATPD